MSTLTQNPCWWALAPHMSLSLLHPTPAAACPAGGPVCSRESVEFCLGWGPPARLNLHAVQPASRLPEEGAVTWQLLLLLLEAHAVTRTAAAGGQPLQLPRGHTPWGTWAWPGPCLGRFQSPSGPPSTSSTARSTTASATKRASVVTETAFSTQPAHRHRHRHRHSDSSRQQGENMHLGELTRVERAAL